MTERGSTHHSGRVDDALAEEVEPLLRGGAESRATDARMHEPPADDEPLPDVRIAGEDRPMPGLLDLDELEARATLAASLRPSAFPADRDTLYAVALEEHAPPDVLEALDALPADRRFVNVQQVWETLGGERERRDVGDVAADAIEPDVAWSEEEPEQEPQDVDIEPVEVEIEIELELEAEDEAVPVVMPEPSPGGDQWWAMPARVGVEAAKVPLKVGIGALRFVRDRLQR